MLDEYNFYPNKYGKPKYRPFRKIDFESGRTIAEVKNNIVWEDYVGLQNKLDTLLNEQISQLEKLLIEAKQMKLHLASMSEEDISEDDIDK